MRPFIPLATVTLFSLLACDKPPPPDQTPPTGSARPQPSALSQPAGPPDDAAWGSARQIQLKELTDHNCSANLLPPWLRLSCVTRPDNSGVVEFEKDIPNAKITHQEGQGDNGPISNTIVFSLKEGGAIPIKAGYFYIPSAEAVADAEARAKNAPPDTVEIPTAHAHHVVFTFKWAGGQAEPTVTTE